MIATSNTTDDRVAGEPDPTSAPSTLGHLLAHAADLNPAGGVREGGELTTWAELDRRAGQLATTLLDLGVTAGDRVGVHYRKSIAGTVAMHAAVRIGAIAVPLDPGAAAGYLASVVEEVGVSVLCTHTPCRRSTHALVDLLAEANNFHQLRSVIGLSEPEEDSSSAITWVAAGQVHAAAPTPPVPVASDDPSYMITTSGSTGRPKAVVHTHASAMAYVERVHRSMQLGSSDRIADVAPHHFDVSTLALWNTPYAAATAVIIPEAYQMLPASLSELLESEAVTIWYSAPFTLRQLEMRGALDQRDLSSVRWALFGGEVYPPAAMAALMAHLPNATLRNVYGPCETNWCSHYDLPGPPTTDETIAIGRPWENTQLRLVLDGKDVDDGEQGEIWIQSPTMMHGYWGRPELNAECFVDIEGGENGGRWYRSGDLGRRRDDGELVFDGRLDHQVKVRGHRIELEFVEAILEDSPAIDLAVVAVTRQADGSDTLVAGVVRRDGSEPDLASVDDHANTNLPAYAKPSSYVVLSSVPETGSGKLDRRTIRATIAEASADAISATAGSNTTSESANPKPAPGRSRSTSDRNPSQQGATGD